MNLHLAGMCIDSQHRNTICAMVKSRYIGDGHPAFNRNPYNGYINPYYWVDDHPLANNGSLDPGTYRWWFFSTHLKHMPKSNWIELPQGSGENRKYLSCHHLEIPWILKPT